ncbi:uncharacterized protein LOC128879222 [Hylaeus volcanicus]|uniref:uncharacterized protein LOC128879222 n=1 Tax=Hylaeus volcanicus TaxID=313075 RepID=UPI0023B7AC88|nr:uncharacterized protein LOC128879222 [Hylaeus volcanicus]
MYDCFNMAYQDKTNALQLNIKVNSENLIPISQRYNAGSLRIPADPSWPKIPQRKLADDVNDTIEPPCIITFTGTPRKSRTVVQTPLNQSPKSTITRDSAYSSFHCQRVTSSMHTLKRQPGFVDPRFKKVTNTKRNHVTPTESLEKKTNHSDLTNSIEPLHNGELVETVPERDINVQQMKIQETANSRGTEKAEEIKTETFHKSNCVQNSKEDNIVNINKETILEQKSCVDSSEFKNLTNTSRSTMNDVKTQVDVNPLPMQENNGQLFYVLDKKLQPHPLNAIHVDTITLPQEYLKQCYNLQVPVLTYQNIPLQIPTIGTNNILQPCLSNLEQRNQTETVSLIKKEAEQSLHSSNTESLKHIIPDQMQNMNTPLSNGSNYPENVFPDAGNKTTEEKNVCAIEKENKLKVQNTVSDRSRENCLKLNGSITNISVNPNIPEKLENTRSQRKQQESSDSEYYVPSIVKRNIHNNIFQNTKKTVCITSGEETTDSEFIPKKSIQRKEFNGISKSTIKTNRINMNCDQKNVILTEKNHPQSVPRSKEHKPSMYQVAARNKSEQNLSCIKNDCTKKLCRSSEPHITFKQKKASAKFSRKAKSYFQKNSHSALVDSDYTLVWPNCQYNKHKCSQMNIRKFNNHRMRKIGLHSNVKLPIHEKNGNAQIESNLNLNEQSYLQNVDGIDSGQEVIRSLSKTGLKNNKCKCEISPRSNGTIESPKGISPKTQELLNKSYWEYYNRLRHKIKNTGTVEQHLYQLTIDGPKTKKGEADETYDKELRNQLKLNPELQTLQHCTALSSMINKALDSNHQSDIVETTRLHCNGNMKSLSDPMANTHSVGANNMMSNFINDEPLLNKLRSKQTKENDKQFLELKSIIFFGGMMYILIIFLPMLYEYFYHEEYDDYENLGYLEFIVDYVLSSFNEAFGGIFAGVKQIFFYPHACKKCNNIA